MTAGRNSRPRPRYGEYADPEAEPQTQVTDEPSATASASAEPARDRAPSFGIVVQDSTHDEDQPPVASQVTQPRAHASGPIPGVPHNLGARGSSSQGVQPAPQGAQTPASARVSTQAPVQAPALGDPAHQSAPNTPQVPATASKNAGTGAANTEAADITTAATIQARPRNADRIATIVLLTVGAYFALSMAFTLSQFPLEFSRVADQLGVKDFVTPPMLNTLGTVGAILVLAIYALVLIFSIRRLRARKVTFWAPLVAGVLAWVLFFVLFIVGLNQSAELWQALLSIASDPAAAQQMLERLNSKS